VPLGRTRGNDEDELGRGKSGRSTSAGRLSRSERVAREKAAINELPGMTEQISIEEAGNAKREKRRASLDEARKEGGRANSAGRMGKAERQAREKAAMGVERGAQHEASALAAQAPRPQGPPLSPRGGPPGSPKGSRECSVSKERSPSPGVTMERGRRDSDARMRRDSDARMRQNSHADEEPTSPSNARKDAHKQDRKAREYAAMALARGEDPVAAQKQFEAMEAERVLQRKRDQKSKKDSEAKKAQQLKKAARIAKEKAAMDMAIGVEPAPSQRDAGEDSDKKGDKKGAPKSASKLSKAERIALERAAMAGDTQTSGDPLRPQKPSIMEADEGRR